MRAVNIKEAKASLNELIDAATNGEQVVLMRGSKHVAAIVPITEADLELVLGLTDAQAEKIWRQVAAEQSAGTTVTFSTPAAAVGYLREAGSEAAANEPKPRYGAARGRGTKPPGKKAGR